MSIYADLTTQNAPAESCNSGEGKDRTNNLQEAGTAMTSMTETPASTKDATCPTWCTSHPPLEPVTVHSGRHIVEGTEVGLGQWPDDQPLLFVDAQDFEDGLTPPQAWKLSRVLASAAVAAATEHGSAKPGTCADWCTSHKREIDFADPTEVTEICRTSVTCGDVTVDVEDSPSWADDQNHGGPIVPPDLHEMGPASARDYAAALIAAARLYEEGK